MNRLSGKVALITGAARNMGAEEARIFAREGARVLITDVLEEAGANLAEEIGESASFRRLDVTREDDWEQTVAHCLELFGRVDVLLQNAGIVPMAPLEELTREQYEACMNVNATGTFLGMRAVTKPMRLGGGGSIINISSIQGMVGSPNLLSYTASKFAIRGMTKAAALELGPHKIRVNSIHPGIVRVQKPRPGQPVQTPDYEAMGAGIPLRRVADVSDIARTALFLASDESAYTTGSEFIVDGGMLAGPTY
ncbi:glucose 1-dehydrogenase [Myxococcota bacterium]|nr:glucose 1-dehydrogenase [Myxococcota bacterium]